MGMRGLFLLALLACVGTLQLHPTDATSIVAVPYSSVWKWYSQTTFPGYAWLSPTFDDTAWESGPGPLGFNLAIVKTVIPGRTATTAIMTSYFRTVFNSTAAGAVGNLTLNVMFAHGIIIYLNGNELTRLNMPTTPPSYSTMSSGKLTQPTYEAAKTAVLTLTPTQLVVGKNVVAVELHQWATSSSYGGFDLKVTLDIVPSATPSPSPTPTALPSGNAQMRFSESWSYLDTGVDLSAANWFAESYNDNTWKTGRTPAGYGFSNTLTLVDFGPDSAARYITTYFRKSVMLQRSADGANTGTLLYNAGDGCIVYFNGVEVGRYNMPAAGTTITAATLALSSITSASTVNTNRVITIPDNLIKNGANVIAVEVHKGAASAKYLRWNAQLTLGAATTPSPSRSPTFGSSASPTSSPEPAATADPSPAATSTPTPVPVTSGGGGSGGGGGGCTCACAALACCTTPATLADMQAKCAGGGNGIVGEGSSSGGSKGASTTTIAVSVCVVVGGVAALAAGTVYVRRRRASSGGGVGGRGGDKHKGGKRGGEGDKLLLSPTAVLTSSSSKGRDKRANNADNGDGGNGDGSGSVDNDDANLSDDAPTPFSDALLDGGGGGEMKDKSASPGRSRKAKGKQQSKSNGDGDAVDTVAAASCFAFRRARKKPSAASKKASSKSKKKMTVTASTMATSTTTDSPRRSGGRRPRSKDSSYVSEELNSDDSDGGGGESDGWADMDMIGPDDASSSHYNNHRRNSSLPRTPTHSPHTSQSYTFERSRSRASESSKRSSKAYSHSNRHDLGDDAVVDDGDRPASSNSVRVPRKLVSRLQLLTPTQKRALRRLLGDNKQGPQHSQSQSQSLRASTPSMTASPRYRSGSAASGSYKRQRQQQQQRHSSLLLGPRPSDDSTPVTLLGESPRHMRHPGSPQRLGGADFHPVSPFGLADDHNMPQNYDSRPLPSPWNIMRSPQPQSHSLPHYATSPHAPSQVSSPHSHSLAQRHSAAMYTSDAPPPQPPSLSWLYSHGRPRPPPPPPPPPHLHQVGLGRPRPPATPSAMMMMHPPSPHNLSRSHTPSFVSAPTPSAMHPRIPSSPSHSSSQRVNYF